MRSGGHVVSKNGNVYSFTLHENTDDGGCFMECQVITYSTLNQHLSSAGSVKTPNIACQSSSILCTNVVYCDELQDSAPCCVIGYISQTSLHLKLCALIRNRFSVVHSQVELSPTLDVQSVTGNKCENIQAWLVDGPRILCVIEDNLYLSDSSLHLTHLVLVPVFDKLVKRLFAVQCIPREGVLSEQGKAADTESIEGSILLFGVASDRHIENDSEFVSIIIQGNRNVSFLANEIAPHNITEDIVAAEVLGITALNNFPCDISFTNPHEPEIELLIYTTQGIIFHFKCGYLSKFVSLPNPLQNPCLLPFHSFTGEEFIIVFSRADSACCILRKETQKFEIVQTMSNIHYVVLDDFVNCGAKQLIMGYFNTTSSVNLNRFALSDFCGQHVDKLAEDTTVSCDVRTHPEESLLSAMDALESRVQAGYESLAEARRLLDRKVQLMCKPCSLAATKKTNKNITDDAMTKNIAVSPLVDLFSGKSQISNLGTTDERKQALEVLSVWQKCAMSHWVIGVHCKNIGERPIWNPSVVVLSKDLSHISTKVHSKCFSIVDSLPPSVMGKAKRKKMEMHHLELCTIIHPAQTAIITVVLKVPRFDKRDTETVLVLCEWMTRSTCSPIPNSYMNSGIENLQQAPSFDQKCFLTTSKPTAYTVSLSVSDILAGNFEIDHNQTQQDEIQRNLAVLNSLQCKYQVTVLSLHLGRLSNVISASLATMGFIQWEVGTQETYIYPQPGPMQLTRCIIQEKLYCKLCFTIFTRDKEQLALFIHTLYHKLPEDVLVLPGSISESTKTRSQLLQCVQDEACFGVDAIRELTFEPKKDDNSQKANLKSWDGDGIKRYFGEKRRLSHVNVDICKEKYRLLVKHNQNMTHETDKLAKELDGLIFP